MAERPHNLLQELRQLAQRPLLPQAQQRLQEVLRTWKLADGRVLLIS